VIWLWPWPPSPTRNPDFEVDSWVRVEPHRHQDANSCQQTNRHPLSAQTLPDCKLGYLKFDLAPPASFFLTMFFCASAKNVQHYMYMGLHVIKAVLLQARHHQSKHLEHLGRMQFNSSLSMWESTNGGPSSSIWRTQLHHERLLHTFALHVLAFRLSGAAPLSVHSVVL